MDPVIDYPELIKRLNRYPEGMSGRVRLIGLIFAPPEAHLAKSEIIPRLVDWHFRSGNHIDFFFAGYTFPHPVVDGFVKVQVPGQDDWLYNSKKFDEFRKDIESRSRWRYSGECDLLLVNACFDPVENKPVIDFSSTICCQLDQMLADRAIDSIGQFFESIFRFAENSTDEDPCWGFSDAGGRKIGGSVLKSALLSLLPKWLSEMYVKAEHHAVRDVSAKAR